MSSYLIRGGHVICRALSRTEATIVSDGAVYQKDGVIVEIGKWQALRAKYPEVEVLGSSDHVVMPGFVNSHHHVGMTPFQLGSPDLPLELWLAHRIAARDVDPYLDTLYSAFEMIESGITTVQHLHGRVGPPLDRMSAVAGRVIEAYQKVGMRVSYSFGIRDQNRLVYEDDDAFAQRLGPGLSENFKLWIKAQSVPLLDNFVLFESLTNTYKDNERVSIQLAPVNLHWCSDQALEMVQDYSHRYQAPMHMHLLETMYQKEYSRRRTGGSAVEYLQKFGLLSPLMTLGHGVWLTDTEIDLIAETKTNICTNASSNLRLRSGIAPLNTFEEKGIRVALGLDEAGINDDRDMLQEMRLVLRLHRTPGMNEDDVPTPLQVFRMATEDGAHTTAFKDKIGILEPGRAADILLVDWKQLAAPYLDEHTAIVDAVVYRARASGISMVMIAGEVVFQNGRFVNVDKDAVLAELAASLSEARSRAEMDRKQLSTDIYPHVQSFYANYCEECATGFKFYSDRHRGKDSLS